MTVQMGPHIVPYVDSKKNQSLVGKKVLPSFNNAAPSNLNKKANKIYVSSIFALIFTESVKQTWLFKQLFVKRLQQMK